ncbi:MAG TPA: DUF1573 domain-containing protein [Deltaproteobacteria bacterium]|nr:DUF1573 domain-containing protein [Deltaproteobacteria bacterium]
MKRSTDASVLVLICVVLLFGWQDAVCSPRVVAESPEYQAGEVPQGALIVHPFSLKNAGDETLSVRVITCTCGGVKFEPVNLAISPGRSDAITVSIPTKYHKGEFLKEILVQTNDPERKGLAFRVRATVREILSVHPRTLVFPPAGTGSAQTRDISVTNAGMQPVTIEGAGVVPGGALTVSPGGKAVFTPGQTKVYQVELRSGARPDADRCEVVLRTDVRELPEIRIPVVIVGREAHSGRMK